MLIRSKGVNNFWQEKIIIVVIISRLLVCFLVEDLIRFYFFFEVVLIPIFILILGWGYQPERIKASLIIFFYTVGGSLPLFLALISVWNIERTLNIMLLLFTVNWKKRIIRIILIIAFLIKLPIFIFHLWLPKAHVEAPVAGSMILAGILLKLGGFGLLLVRIMVLEKNILVLFSTVSLLGGGFLSAALIRFLDIKVIIAYSSVVHIRIVAVRGIMILCRGVKGNLIIILGHGLGSSGIFRAANSIYLRSHSRRMIFNKGVLRLAPSFSSLWFLLIVMNFGGPFTINLVREIILIISIIRLRKWSVVILVLICFFSLTYNLILYSTRQQGIDNSIIRNYDNINSREIIVLTSHVWPSVILTLLIQF